MQNHTCIVSNAVHTYIVHCFIIFFDQFYHYLLVLYRDKYRVIIVEYLNFWTTIYLSGSSSVGRIIEALLHLFVIFQFFNNDHHQSVVESLSEEQHELPLDATLFGSNGLPLKCSKLALGEWEVSACFLNICSLKYKYYILTQ